MGINELISNLKKCSIDNRDLPIRIESPQILNYATSLISNRSNSCLKALVVFDENGESALFNAISTSQNQKNLADFLAEENTRLSVVSNDIEKFKNTDAYKSAKKSKFELRPVTNKFVQKISETSPLRSYLVGDGESVIIGDFDFAENGKPTFINFYDKQNGNLLNEFHSNLVDFILNGSVLKGSVEK